MVTPEKPKIYHIVHIDRLKSIVNDEFLWCDAEIMSRECNGPMIGINSIKQRRMRLLLNSHKDLRIGECVPFYFCPRSIMLYLINQANSPALEYRGGQEKIIHLESDLYKSITWAIENNRRWAFTLSNAGSKYFEDRNDINRLHEINWDAVNSDRWGGNGISENIREGKQAEFLIEKSFPFKLFDQIGVYSQEMHVHVTNILQNTAYVHSPQVKVNEQWCYL